MMKMNQNILKTKKVKDEVKKLYLETDLNCIDIAKKVKLHRTTVSRLLKNNDITVKAKIKKIYIYCEDCGKEMLDNSRNRKRCGSCNTSLRRRKLKKKAIDYLGGKCEKCGWSGHPVGFDFHHKYDKSFNINTSTITSRKWSLLIEELDKCELLCAICHRIKHAKY